MKKILLAPDSFKGTLSAARIIDLLKDEFRKTLPGLEILSRPVSDGGEGFVRACCLDKGVYHTLEVSGPLGTPVLATYGTLGDVAIVEMASASGIELLTPTELAPFRASTYGFGVLLRHVLLQNYRRVYIGLGGSATHDVGMGMLRGLGVYFNGKNREIVNFREVENIESITYDNVYNNIINQEIICASDVRNQLLGTEGAAHIYAPQKGADSNTVNELERLTSIFADKVENHFGKEFRATEGTGAAGGTAFALMSFFGARSMPGFEIVRELTALDTLLDSCDLVITGEGNLDRQSSYGKVPVRLMELARGKNIPVIGIFGGIETPVPGFDLIISLTDLSGSKDKAMDDGEHYLRLAAQQVIRYITDN
jgi:glycerate kinase